MTIEEIAVELKAAARQGQQAFGRAAAMHYAETIDIVHVPPISADGPFDRAAFSAHMEKENAAFARALPDLDYSNRIEVQGDRIATAMTLAGTMADGTQVRATIPIAYGVRDGKIVSVTTEVSPETVTTMMKVLNAAGFEAAAT